MDTNNSSKSYDDHQPLLLSYFDRTTTAPSSSAWDNATSDADRMSQSIYAVNHDYVYYRPGSDQNMENNFGVRNRDKKSNSVKYVRGQLQQKKQNERQSREVDQQQHGFRVANARLDAFNRIFNEFKAACSGAASRSGLVGMAEKRKYGGSDRTNILADDDAEADEDVGLTTIPLDNSTIVGGDCISASTAAANYACCDTSTKLTGRHASFISRLRRRRHNNNFAAKSSATLSGSATSLNDHYNAAPAAPSLSTSPQMSQSHIDLAQPQPSSPSFISTLYNRARNRFESESSASKKRTRRSRSSSLPNFNDNQSSAGKPPVLAVSTLRSASRHFLQSVRFSFRRRKHHHHRHRNNHDDPPAAKSPVEHTPEAEDRLKRVCAGKREE